MVEINKEIEKQLEKQFPKGHKSRGRALVLVAIAQIELGKAVQQAKANWIKCSDELPKHLLKVLGYNDLGKKFGHIDIVCYDERDKSFSPFWDELLELETITHWQPLPEKPKE